jgi:uncharacterized membrane protein YeaQ/YmgE (transglycosylase-associated protein family)
VLRGFIIGLLARLIMPGKLNIGLIMTTVLGVVGGLIGSWVAGLFKYSNANGGFEWIPPVTVRFCSPTRRVSYETAQSRDAIHQQG